MVPSKAEAAAASFERHVETAENILATSAPLDLEQLDVVLLQVTEGLANFPELKKQTSDLRTELIEDKTISSAAAVSRLLSLLEDNSKALQYFKAAVVGVINGEQIPLKAPHFGVAVPVKDLTVSDEEVAASATATKHEQPHSEERLAPIFKKQIAAGARAVSPLSEPNATRKRALEKMPASGTAGDSSGEETDKKRKLARANGAAARWSGPQLVNRVGYRSQEAKERGMNPTYTIPTQWEDLYYQDVEVINVQQPGAKERIHQFRFAGTPFILEGHSGWTTFAEDWVKPDGSLDSGAFLRGIHDVKVPVIEKNYEEFNPIKTYLPLSYYVKNYWEHGKPDYYMHQWQFPLSPKAGKLLCYKCEELPVVGDNLLLYWLDAVRGDNPLQYLFMGQKTTVSRMHLDPGGLDITIAPIIGTKRVTMLHRSAAKLDSVHETVNFHEVDLDKSPLLAFLPAWQCDINPGQILFMPEGTLHACENTTACLSYHRFHVDGVNLPGFLQSFMAQDATSINHAEILWNAAHDVMATLEENYHANGQQLDNKIFTLRKLDSLRALRHACRVISLEEAVPTGDTWDWSKLLEDIDYLLVRIDCRAANNVKANSTFQATAAAAAAALQSSDSDEAAPEVIDMTTPTGWNTKNRSHSLSSSSDALASSGASKVSANTASTHWESLALKKGDIVGVQVFEKRNRAEVLRVELNKELVQVHYVDWGSIYDEFLPVGYLFHRGRNSRKVQLKHAPKVHETVLARWGSRGELYPAIVLKVIRTNACLVHYLKYEKDWDQWVLPGHIFRKYDK